MATTNNSFNGALKAYCIFVISVFNRRTQQSDGLPYEIKQQFKMESSHGYSQRYAQEIDWFAMNDIIERELSGMSLQANLLRAIEGDQRIGRHFDALVGTSEESLRFQFDAFLRSLNIRLWDVQGIEFNESEFEKMYEQLENSFHSDFFTFRCFAPIENFQMKEAMIELDPGFSITRFPDEDKQDILASSAQSGRSNKAIAFIENIFETYIVVPKVIGGLEQDRSSSSPGPYELARHKFDAACEALRLFQQGAIGFNYVWLKNTSWVLDGGTTIRWSSAPATFIGKPYVLPSGDNWRFREFWQKYNQSKGTNLARLDLALRRFDFGYQRTMPEDKIIDYMIALEALLLNKTEGQELGFRLSLRGSALLGSTPEERKTIYEELNVGYRERSNIAHGGSTKDVVKVSGRQIPFGDFVMMIEDRLRSTIKEFLFRAGKQTEAQVLNEIDKMIIARP